MNIAMDDYIKVRHAMVKGARTLEDIKNNTDIIIETDEISNEIENILKTICTCKKVSLEEVLTAVKNGADTVEKIGDATKAGTSCGRCKAILGNVLEIGR